MPAAVFIDEKGVVDPPGVLKLILERPPERAYQCGRCGRIISYKLGQTATHRC